jgi:chromate reductase, NAD(P)H dehydrogenase (quinone)
MKKILAFAGSNSAESINHILIETVASMVTVFPVEIIRLNQFNPPIFGVDIEKDFFPKEMKEFAHLLKQYDGYILATPEHNSMPTAFFLNILEWLSRTERHFFGHKPFMVLSTSPGDRGAETALQILSTTLPRFGAIVSGTYALPNFNKNIVNHSLVNQGERLKLMEQLAIFENAMSPD